jgi:hypothetical protein
VVCTSSTIFIIYRNYNLYGKVDPWSWNRFGKKSGLLPGSSQLIGELDFSVGSIKEELGRWFYTCIKKGKEEMFIWAVSDLRKKSLK